MKPRPTKTLHSSDESLRDLPLFYAVQLLGIFSFQSGIMEMNWKLASVVLSSQLSPFHSTVNCTNCWGRQPRQLVYFFFFSFLAVTSILISWWPQTHHGSQRAAPLATLWEQAPWWMKPALPSEIRVVETKAPDAIFMSVYESWDSSLEPVRAGCCWILTMRWCTALALSEIYG